jgi:hypothetical protein
MVSYRRRLILQTATEVLAVMAKRIGLAALVFWLIVGVICGRFAERSHAALPLPPIRMSNTGVA